MSPAVRRAAAYVYLTGWRPKGVHLATLGRLADVTKWEPQSRRVAGIWIGSYVVVPSHLAEVRRDGLAVAGDVLARCGAKAETERLTSHYVAFVGDGWRGLAHRGGGGSVRFDLARDAAPYNRGAAFSDKAAREYLASLDYKQGAWLLWANLARELCAARYSDEPDAWNETDAMGAHAAGLSPFAYALRAHRKAAAHG